jgi:NADH-quinone oxidoreductase subunit A
MFAGAIIYASAMPDNYFARYLALLMQLAVALLLAGTIVVLSELLGRHRFSRAKSQPYECGIIPVGDARERFSVKFYLVAMVFILFDVEAVFLYPWAILLRELKMFGFWEMLVYIGIVLVGFFYVWKKGVLDWGLARVSGARVGATPSFERATPGSGREDEPRVLPVGVEGSKN